MEESFPLRPLCGCFRAIVAGDVAQIDVVARMLNGLRATLKKKA